MRTSSLVIGLAPLSALAQGINITETNEVNLANGTGNLGWGATNLPFGYSAGVGFNFAESTLFFSCFFFFREGKPLHTQYCPPPLLCSFFLED